MEWNATWTDPLTSYVAAFDELIGDKRTHKTFGETIRGISGSGSLIWKPIAVQSPILSQGKKGAQRVIRLAMGESTHRSELDDRHLTARLRAVAVEQLEQASEEPTGCATRGTFVLRGLHRLAQCSGFLLMKRPKIPLHHEKRRAHKTYGASPPPCSLAPPSYHCMPGLTLHSRGRRILCMELCPSHALRANIPGYSSRLPANTPLGA